MLIITSEQLSVRTVRPADPIQTHSKQIDALCSTLEFFAELILAERRLAGSLEERSRVARSGVSL